MYLRYLDEVKHTIFTPRVVCIIWLLIYLDCIYMHTLSVLRTSRAIFNTMIEDTIFYSEIQYIYILRYLIHLYLILVKSIRNDTR